MSRQTNNKHLVFEGLNKSGKSTVINETQAWLTAKGMPVSIIREPGGTQMAEGIRHLLLSGPERRQITDVLLFNAARAETVKRIGELLVESHVIADRSYISTLAFQVHGDGAPEEETRAICDYALGDDYNPDAVFLLDIPYESYVSRIKPNDPPDYFERDVEHFERVRQGYLLEGKRVGAYILDASKPKRDVVRGVLSLIEGVL